MLVVIRCLKGEVKKSVQWILCLGGKQFLSSSVCCPTKLVNEGSATIN